MRSLSAGAAAAIRYGADVDLGHVFHQLAREMRGGAIAGVGRTRACRVAHRAVASRSAKCFDRGIGFPPGNRLLDEPISRDGREIGERIVGQLVVKVWVERRARWR